MIRRALPALASALALAAAAGGARAEAAAAAPAESLFDGFRALCVDTGGDRAAALAAADRKGWSPVPDSLLAAMGGQFENASGRLKSSAAGMTFLILGEQTDHDGGKPLHMKACSVGGSATDDAAAAATTALQAYAAVPQSERSTAGRSVWAYADDGGRHTPLAVSDEAALKAAAARGTARVLMQMSAPSPSPMLPGRLVIIALAVPTL